jgi:hypothetical protein
MGESPGDSNERHAVPEGYAGALREYDATILPFPPEAEALVGCIRIRDAVPAHTPAVRIGTAERAGR